MAMAPEQVGIGIRRYFTKPGEHPYDSVEWERREARIPNWKDGTDAFLQPDVEFPVGWSQNSTNIVAQKYFRGTLGTEERETSLRQVIDRVADTITTWGVQDGYFTDEQEGCGLPQRAQAHPRHPARRLQLAGVVQHRGQGRAAAGERVLHPRRRRHDGRHPQLVPRGGHDLQGRFRFRHQPLQHPLVVRAPQGRRHRERPGELHARRRRVGRHHQERRQDPPRRQDGDPELRPPRRRGVHLVQGHRGEEGACAARRRLRHGPRRQGLPLDPVPERQQLGAGHRRVHAGRGRRRRLGPEGRDHRRDHPHGEGARPVPPDLAGRVGVRRPGHAVRHHGQPVAHRAQQRPHQRQQPVLRVHAHRQLGVQPRQHQPAEVPRRRRHRSTSRPTSTPSR